MSVEEIQMVQDRIDSISIEKNSKGYNFSIKLYYNADKTTTDEILEKLADINKKLIIQYGQ